MTNATKYVVLETGDRHVKAWVRGVEIADNARDQLLRTAQLPVVHPYVAAMPDVHYGIGATIGSVIPTREAIIPAAVGVDIGCGMCAARTTLTAADLPDDLRSMRNLIERAVPHGRTTGRGRSRDKGSWNDVPNEIGRVWADRLEPGFERLVAKTKALRNTNNLQHLGTLGTGNHFIEICLDEAEQVWVMLHSGSRGVGNRIATIYIEKAKRDMEDQLGHLPDNDLAYFREGSEHFDDYVEAVSWAQEFARINRDVMLKSALGALRRTPGLREFQVTDEVVNCHHNYVQKERHHGEDVWITRKGAVRAGRGELGIIPGSMGAQSFIISGKGNADSFESCSHGAGRTMSRTKAKKLYSIEDHRTATAGVECRKDAGVLDETPMAYKDIRAVMDAQSDLVDIVHTLKQVVCVKG